MPGPAPEAELGPFAPHVRRALDRLAAQDFSRRLAAHDPSLWSADPFVQESIRRRLGWLDSPAQMASRLGEVRQFAGWVREKGYTCAVLLGMGGSSLAPEVFQQTFGPAEGYPALMVLDTTDPGTIRAAERTLNLDGTLFIVSSKSGATIETASLYRYFAARVREHRGKPGALDQFAAITDPGTPLEEEARREGFGRVYLNPPDIGGRFSALSYFGLVPAAAIGGCPDRLLERAQAFPLDDGLWLGAALWALAMEGRDKLTLLLPPRLAAFGAWIEQLVAESTGKDGKGIVPVCGEPPGPPSAYGTDRAFVRVRMEGEDDGADALARALADAGHPVLTVSLRDANDLGAEFLRWEIATAAAAALLGVNPFDEPNVSESKENTARVLQDYLRSAQIRDPSPVATDGALALSCDERTLRTLAPEEGRPVPALLAAHLYTAREGDYYAVLAYLPPTAEHDAALTRLRVALRDATRRAATVGYGPRYLHSTGQLHKGGPDNAVFLQITVDDPEELPVPGEAYGFSTLKRAQALGDLMALQARGRRAVRIHISGPDVAGGLQRLVSTVAAILS